MKDERLKILDMLQSGEISSEEAEARLKSLEQNGQIIIKSKAENPSGDSPILGIEGLWMLPLGLGLTILGFFGLVAISLTSFFAFVCLSPFLLVGGALATVGLWSRSSHWIHVRVSEKNGDEVNISLPFPLGMFGAFLRLAQPLIKARVGDVNLDELDLAAMITAMGDELSPENPIMVVVDDDDEQVMVYIT